MPPPIRPLTTLLRRPLRISTTSSFPCRARPTLLLTRPFTRPSVTPNNTPSTKTTGPPKTHDRGPPSDESTQTDFSTLDVLGGLPAPSTAIDACLWDGFHLDSGLKIVAPGGAGVLLVGGSAYAWYPWQAGKGDKKRLVNKQGQFEVEDESWGVLELLWPKPDLLIIGVGKEMRPLSPSTRRYINGLGIRIDIQDTRNAAAQFNLLATERGVANIAAALIPMGWKDGVGVK